MKNNKRYVKCDMCDGTGYIEDDTFVEVRQHTQHGWRNPASPIFV